MVISGASDLYEGCEIMDGGTHASASRLMFIAFVPPRPIEARVPLGKSSLETHAVSRIELPAKGWGIIKSPTQVKRRDPAKPRTDPRSFSSRL